MHPETSDDLLDKLDAQILEMKSKATRELAADYPIQTISRHEFEHWFAQCFEEIAENRRDLLEPTIKKIEGAFLYLFDLGKHLRDRYGEEDKAKRIFTAFVEWFASNYSGYQIKVSRGSPPWTERVVPIADFIRSRANEILTSRDTDPARKRAEIMLPDNLEDILAAPFYDNTWQVAEFKRLILHSPVRSGFYHTGGIRFAFWEWAS